MIIYFTGTGNSRIIAEKLGELLSDEVKDALNAIKEGGEHSFCSVKPYVFVCPTYAWDIPRIFRSFILSSSFEGNSLAYFVMTCGGSIGGPDKGLKKLCEEKHLMYKGVKAVVMPENYVAMFSVPGQEECSRIIDKALSGLPELAGYVRDERALPGGSILGRLKTSAINAPFYRFSVSAKGFWTENTCIGCGTCEKLCPLGNIKIADGHPSWGDSCTHCMACISACPVKAVQYGKSSEKRNRIFNGKVR